MKTIHIFCLLAWVALLCACGAQPGAVTNPPAMITATKPVPPTSVPVATQPLSLSEAQLRNMTFHVPVYDRKVTLVEGSFEEAGILWVNLLPQIAFGDLNDDRMEDAVVMLAENGGGSGTFVLLVAVLNQEGQPVQSSTILIDDRPLVAGVGIVAGKIVVQATVHSASDPACCPALPVTQTYMLDKGRLVLLHRVTYTASGTERSITITNPVSGSLVSAPVQIQGSMPITPFENNLVYRVYDLDFNELEVGPFGVISTTGEMGGPALFDNAISSPAFMPGATLWFELSEPSMKDGTALAIERIKLTFP